MIYNEKILNNIIQNISKKEIIVQIKKNKLDYYHLGFSNAILSYQIRIITKTKLYIIYIGQLYRVLDLLVRQQLRNFYEKFYHIKIQQNIINDQNLYYEIEIYPIGSYILNNIGIQIYKTFYSYLYQNLKLKKILSLLKKENIFKSIYDIKLVFIELNNINSYYLINKNYFIINPTNWHFILIDKNKNIVNKEYSSIDIQKNYFLSSNTFCGIHKIYRITESVEQWNLFDNRYCLNNFKEISKNYIEMLQNKVKILSNIK